MIQYDLVPSYFVGFHSNASKKPLSRSNNASIVIIKIELHWFVLKTILVTHWKNISMGRVSRYKKIKACDPFAKKSSHVKVDTTHDLPPDAAPGIKGYNDRF